MEILNLIGPSPLLLFYHQLKYTKEINIPSRQDLIIMIGYGAVITPNDSNFSKFDYLIIGLGSMIFYLSVAMIIKEPRQMRLSDTNNSSVIAKVIAQTGQIKRKNQNEISWMKADQGEHFYPQDMIFTGEDSTAEISLQNGSFLSLGPNTLMTFSITNGIANLTLNSGSMMGNISEDTLEIKIAAPDGEKRFIANNAIVNMAAGNKSHVELLKGHGILQEKEISANKSAIEIINPQDEDLILLIPNQKIEFSWSTSQKIPQFEFICSQHFNFQKLLLKKMVTSDGISIPAEIFFNLPSTLYWKIIGRNDQQEIIANGPILKLRTSIEKSLNLLTPRNHQTLYTNQKKLLIST